ncbi:MAG: bifunctional diaminohydroxyphosphoribosylaminopyrimidine deaminase/5-amino-6-(5-phosphoribosylamino)uracil reductase RibD, partial [Candidatus Dormibacteria bacterium]
MSRALELAAGACHQTSPNPMVGAVVVRDGRVVGEGFHARAGEAHAEVRALAAAGDLARGATVYVTLEPCSSQGRTGPCTRALLESGIARLVMAMEDPFQVGVGMGIGPLRGAGIAVEVGDGEAEAGLL